MFTPLLDKYGSYISRIFKTYCLKILLLAAGFITGFSGIVHAMAAPPAGGNGAPQGAGAMFQSFLPLILIFAIFYFLLIKPQQKKAKEQKEMLGNLKKGDKVMTNGGIYGLIEDIDENTVTLKVGIKDDVKIKINRAYVASLRNKEQG